jgi:hypothetical protein
MDGTDLASEVEGNDEGDGEDLMPSLGGDDIDDDLEPNELLYDNGVHPDDEVAAANATILNTQAEAGAEGEGGISRPSSRAGSVRGAGRGRGGEGTRRRGGTHMTPISRSRNTRREDTSPDEGPGGRIANFMAMMMMNNASDREERREEREERRQEFRLQLQQQQQQQQMMMMMMISAMGGNGRGTGIGGVGNAGSENGNGGAGNAGSGGDNNNDDYVRGDNTTE